MGLAATLQPTLRNFKARVYIDIRRFPWLQTVTIALASGVVFGLGFSLSLSTFLTDNVAVCWPLVGLQVAALLRIPRRHWPPVIIGILISQVILEWREPADEMIVDAICDIAELLIAAFCLPALKGVSDWIKQPHLLKRFIIWPMLLGPALTAFPVAAVFSHELGVNYWRYWARWFTGDMLGVVLWLPLGVILISRETYDLFAWKALPRTIGLIGTLSLAGWAIFNFRPTPVAFVLMPLLLLIAFRLGFSGSAIAVNILCVLSAKGTLHHLGPFGLIPEPYNVTALQLYLAFCMLMCFPVSIILLERDDFERATKAAYQKMEQLAISDGLTGLANRRRFDTVFAEEWRRAIRAGDPIAVMMIDVDCFKLFNDLYGHLAGDDCLRKIADSIRSTVRRAGDLPARFGGEEFVVLMPRTNLSGALEVAEAVRLQVELLRLEHKRNPHNFVTISIGCWSTIPKADVLPDSLIDAADQGLYCAKQSGRNRIVALETPNQPLHALQERSFG